MIGRQKKKAHASLDEAKKEYDKVYADLKNRYEKLDKSSDDAIILVSNVEALVESIRHRPWSYGTVKHKIEVKKRQFVGSRELKRKERNKNLVAGAVTIGSMTLIALMKDKFKRYHGHPIIGVLLSVLVLIGYLFYRIFNSIKMVKEVNKRIEIIKEETNKNQCLFEKVGVLLKEINATAGAAQEFYNNLKEYTDCDFKQLPEKIKDDFSELYNLTLTLAELVNKQVG